MSFAAYSNLADVMRFAAVELAHELRKDVERGVFSRQELATIGLFAASVPVGLHVEAWALAVGGAIVAGWFTWAIERQERRWRDERRTE